MYDSRVQLGAFGNHKINKEIEFAAGPIRAAAGSGVGGCEQAKMPPWHQLIVMRPTPEIYLFEDEVAEAIANGRRVK